MKQVLNIALIACGLLYGQVKTGLLDGGTHLDSLGDGRYLVSIVGYQEGMKRLEVGGATWAIWNKQGEFESGVVIENRDPGGYVECFWGNTVELKTAAAKLSRGPINRITFTGDCSLLTRQTPSGQALSLRRIAENWLEVAIVHERLGKKK